MAGGIRWAFCWETWMPTKAEWELGLKSIQSEEVQRIQKFHFQKDGKSSLIGRIMLRKAIHDELGIPWKEINLLRTEKGKPYLDSDHPDSSSYSVNVSHHGDYTVLASSKACQLGIDVMKTEWPKGKESLDEYFRLMNRQFTEHEWRTIRQYDDEWDQLSMFTRHWCLKESYVKALGIGIGFELQRIEFHIYSDLALGHYTSDTRVHIDGKIQENWRFEETKLDDTHCTATAMCMEDGTRFSGEPVEFTQPSFSDLMKNAEKLGHMIRSDSYSDFTDRKDRPVRRRNSLFS